MGRNDKIRKRLLKRKVFKNYDNWDYEDCFLFLYVVIWLTSLFIILAAFVDMFRNNWEDEEDITMVVKAIASTCIYIFGLALSVLIVSKKVREKCFKLCSFLAILHIFLILFIVFHSFQIFVPEPRTEKLVEIFKVSLYAAFIWIPALIISLFSCAIILWKASDQSELYTVILDGKRSSTKIMDP